MEQNINESALDGINCWRICTHTHQRRRVRVQAAVYYNIIKTFNQERGRKEEEEEEEEEKRQTQRKMGARKEITKETKWSLCVEKI